MSRTKPNLEVMNWVKTQSILVCLLSLMLISLQGLEANEIAIYKGSYTIADQSDVSNFSYSSYSGRHVNRVAAFLVVDLTTGETFVVPYVPRNRSHYWFAHFRNGNRFCVSSYRKSFILDEAGPAAPYAFFKEPLGRGERWVGTITDNSMADLDGFGGAETSNSTVGFLSGVAFKHRDAGSYGFPQGFSFPKRVTARTQNFQRIPYGIRTSGTCNAYLVDGDSFFTQNISHRYVMNRKLTRSANDPSFPPLNDTSPGTIEFGINLVRALLLDAGYREFTRAE